MVKCMSAKNSLAMWDCAVRPSLFFFQAEEGIRVADVTGVQTCALPICGHSGRSKPNHTGRRASVRQGRIEGRASGACACREGRFRLRPARVAAGRFLEIRSGRNETLVAQIGKASCREKV